MVDTVGLWYRNGLGAVWSKGTRGVGGRKVRMTVALSSLSGSFDCVTHDETVSHFAQDDSFIFVQDDSFSGVSQRCGGSLEGCMEWTFWWLAVGLPGCGRRWGWPRRAGFWS